VTSDIELKVEYDDLQGLRAAWRSFVSHGALMTEVYPPPSLGASVVALVSLRGGKISARLTGEVIQSSASATIINLNDLPQGARDALVSMGLTEARADGVTGPVSAPVTSAVKAEKPGGPLRQGAGKPSAPRDSFVPPKEVVPRSSQGHRPVSQVATERLSEAASAHRHQGALEWAYHVLGDDLQGRLSGLPPASKTGDVGEASWRDALIRFFMERLTGVVVIQGFREDRWLFLVGGKPVHFVLQKAHLGESLGEVLTAQDMVEKEQWEGAKRAHESDLSIAERLVAEGCFSTEDLHACLHRRAASITRSLVRANFGEWSFHPAPEIERRLCWPAVDVLDVLLDAERRVMASREDEEIVRTTEGLLSHHVSILEGRKDVLAALPFRPRERSVIDDLLPGGWTIKEMFVYCEMQEQELLRFLLLLRSLATIDFLESEGERSKRNRAERALYVGLREVTQRGHFEALHCHWTAIEEEVERGYQTVLTEFSRKRFERVYDDRIGELVERIEARATELFQQLKTKQGRDAVRKTLVGPSQLIMAADLMGKQANMAVYKGRFDLARLCYLRVLELAVRGPECAEHVRNAKEQLAREAIRTATSSVGVNLVNLTGAVDDLLSRSRSD